MASVIGHCYAVNFVFTNNLYCFLCVYIYIHTYKIKVSAQSYIKTEQLCSTNAVQRSIHIRVINYIKAICKKSVFRAHQNIIVITTVEVTHHRRKAQVAHELLVACIYPEFSQPSSCNTTSIQNLSYTTINKAQPATATTVQLPRMPIQS